MDVVRASILLLTFVNLSKTEVISTEKESHVAKLHVPDQDKLDFDLVDVEALTEPDKPGVGPVDQKLGTRAEGNSKNSFKDRFVRAFSLNKLKNPFTRSKSTAASRAPSSTTSNDPQRFTPHNTGSATPRPKNKNQGRMTGVPAGKSKPGRGGMDALNKKTSDSESDSDSSSDRDPRNKKVRASRPRQNKATGRLMYDPNRGVGGGR